MRKLLKHAATPFRLVARSQEIGLVFVSYGLGGVLTSLGFEVGRRGLRWGGKSNPSQISLDSVLGKNLARTFVRLGPTFIKLGQMLASRPDLVGEPVAEELKVLLDRVPPISFRKIRKILQVELGKAKLKKLIAEIDPEPIASASLGQIHRARLADGRTVLLKVQKPGAEDLVRLDLKLMETFVLSTHFLYPRINLLQVFDDFKAATLREIDYLEEARNIKRFRKNYRKLISVSDAVFPNYFPELTTSKVIALEPMSGKKIADLEKGSRRAKKAAAAGVTAILEQIFDHGFFHADPHAGNLFFLEETGRLGFIDLGLVGQLTDEDRQKFLKVLFAVLKRDRRRLAQALLELGTSSKDTNTQQFEKDIDALIEDLKTQGLEGIKLEQTIQQLLAIARKHGLSVPNRYLMMLRSCLLMEGVAKSLYPELSLAKIATPIVAKSLLKTYSPWRWVRK